MHCKLTQNFGLKIINLYKKPIQETSNYGNVIYIQYTIYFCFPIEMASSAEVLKVLLMHVVNVGPWQVLPNNSSSLQHMSLVTPFQQLISPAGQLGGAQKTIVMASVLSSSKNKMKITPDQSAKVNTYSVIYMPHKEVPKTVWAHPYTDMLSPATAHTAHWRGPNAI